MEENGQQPVPGSAKARNINIAIILITLALVAVLIIMLSREKEGPAPKEKQKKQTPGPASNPKPTPAKNSSKTTPKPQEPKELTPEELVAKALAMLPKGNAPVPNEAMNIIRDNKDKPGVEQALFKSLGAKEPEFRRGALAILKNIGKLGIVRQMLPTLIEDHDQSVRLETIEASVSLRAVEMYDTFDKLARTEKDFSKAPKIIRLRCINACVFLAPDKAGKLLTDLLSSAPPEIKIEAMKAVISIKLISAIPDILTITEQKCSPALWQEAQYTILALAPDKEPELLANALLQDSVNIRQAALEKLAATGQASETAIKRTLEILKKQPYEQLRRPAVLVIERVMKKDGIQHLIYALEDVDKEVRAAAAAALKRLTGKDFGENGADWDKWWQENAPKKP